MESKLTFTECELITNDSLIPNIDIFGNKQGDIYDLDGISYVVNCEIVDETLFWVYVIYGKVKPYADKLLNIETKEYTQNTRSPNEAELRNQIFYMYVPQKAVLYVSNFQKNKFLTNYLKDRFEKDFSIRKYIVDPKAFVNEINSVKSLRFLSTDKNLFNNGIFDDVRDVCGYGNDESLMSFNIEIQLKESKFNPIKWLNFLKEFKHKKDKLEIDKMICVGKDDKNIEKIFNLDNVLKKIQISVLKNENEMYDPEQIKKAVLEQLNV